MGDNPAETLAEMVARARAMAINIHAEMLERNGVPTAAAKILAESIIFA